MFYDMGKMSPLQPLTAKVVVVLVLLGTIGALCVSLSIAVRIGDLILGW